MPAAIIGKRGALWLLVGLTLLAAALRLYQIEVVPLRGDEAFSVRFWADDPLTTWHELTAVEPHPIGTFWLFWLWRNTAGDSEFAMRALPMLGNLLGVAVMMALGKRLLGRWHLAALLGLLWAINPFQVWHAQDVRNYALWAVFSPLAMWLFLCALDTNKPRDWLLYGIAEVIALYTFLLEPFFLLIHGIYLLAYHRDRLRRGFLAWGGIALACIPLFIQLIRLARSDYSGTATTVTLDALIQRFIPTLLFGERELSLVLGGLLLIGLIGGLALMRGKGQLKTRVLLGLWAFLPLVLLTVFGTQMAIFRPRYIIPITAPLLLIIIWITTQLKFRYLPQLMTLILVVLSSAALYDYFEVAPPKSPDWRSLASYLNSRTRPDDVIILANVDPAFRYYYLGDAEDKPWSEVENPADLIMDYNGVYVQNADPTFEIAQYMQAEAQEIFPSISLMKQYRDWEATPDEIEHRLDLQLGDVAILRGYTMLGGDGYGLTVILYWEPLRRTETEYVGFVHALIPAQIGAIAQDDHAPLLNNAPTTAWIPGDLLRDPFLLRLPPDEYELVVGMYETGSGDRLNISLDDSQRVGDQYTLTTINIR